jgi:hypothetical protein
MDAIRRTSTLRRVATTASLAALLLAPSADAAKGKRAQKPKSPVITSVSPMTAKIGDTLTIKGHNFRKGKGKNSVGFKRDGSAVVFVRSDLSTFSKMTVKLPAKLEKVMYGKETRFHLRVLSERFGKSFTGNDLSPLITPRPVDPGDDDGGTVPNTPPPVTGPADDCDDDGVKNVDDSDDDNDLLPDTRENAVGTDGCKADTDGDGVSDGYEYRSAIDLNDDEYQTPNATQPYPGNLPYPNPLSKDAEKDYDGDGLPMATEYDLWVKLTPAADRTLEDSGDKSTPLAYSDGLQYSVGRRCGAGETGGPCAQGNVNQNRRVPTLTGDNYVKYLGFLDWLAANGYRNPVLHDTSRWFNYGAGWHTYDILDIDRNGTVSAAERTALDANGDGYLSDDERDEDADGLSNFDEIRGRMTPQFWSACYSAETDYAISYQGTDPAKADTDGDGIRDGADDQDHDDVPNLMELSRMAASHLDDTDDGIKESLTGGGRLCKADEDLKPEDKRHPNAFGKVQPFNPCDPDPESRTCELHPLIGAEPGPDWWSLQ